MCYKAIEDGDVATLKVAQSKCHMYKGNQCHALPIEDSIGDKAMKTTVTLFPQALKGKLPALCLVVFLALTGVGANIGNAAQSQFPNSVTANTLDMTDNNENTMALLSNREIVQHYNLNPSHLLRTELLNRAENVAWEEMFVRTQENSDLLIRLHGYITSVQTDFLFGSYITVGRERALSPTDIRINFDYTNARVGDEVIIFLIPVFVGHDTPLRSWEWTQIRIQ